MRCSVAASPGLILLLSTFACSGGHGHGPASVQVVRPVSILVEVFDPTTNFVWENVSVRVVEAEQEWSQCTCVSPFEDWFLTDTTGQVLFDEFTLAAEQVGFVQDGAGAAVLGSRRFEDQATVTLEIDAVGFSPVFIDVPLSYGQPDVFVQVPFQ